ncbi:family 78 glycoside hydrolase catalytic domain [Hominenteromicrobium sp.]|uniref:family 78 glycoside hydrolase catalytic domain n=1 Tax=Hominenteromicrobium sp. TaxID=3073581 RepID=UPI003AB47982
MEFSKSFIRASEAYNTFEHHVPAPYLRRAFQIDHEAKANVIITALGFYELYLNGERITKGRLAPYISNPDDLVYYDTYEVTLRAGENVLGVWLGNGFTNNPGGHIWDFDIAAFRAAPQMALCLTYTGKSGEAHCIESDETWRTESSPLLFDDYRFGEIYDGRLEIPGWNTIGFDDSAWKFAERAPQPRGEKRLCTAEPIDIVNELKPISVTKTEKGYLYDFGINTAGVCRLCVRGELDQRIELRHGEHLKDGLPDVENIWFKREHWARDLEYVHKDVYTCRGDGEEVYTPAFTYHGFRYVLVSGITEAQATEDLLTALEMHSLLEERGGFSCSDETANKLQQMTRQSDVTNFYYFPTDCPQREKNGWTADAALSSEHILLNLGAEKSYREWLRAIVKAQDNNGALPGIVPTSGWGFAWGNGPAWDSVLIELPYRLYQYRGDLDSAKLCAPAIIKYLHYLTTRMDEHDLLAIGLGDWCPPGREAHEYKSPLAFTDTVLSKDMADKAAFLFDKLNMPEQAAFARALSKRWKAAVRKYLIDENTMLAAGNCQTSQAMAIYYSIFEPAERKAAFEQLINLIEEQEYHLDVGVLGGRVLFHVLTDFGYSDLAFSMITRPDYPSYGNWIARGATTLWELFQPEGSDRIGSLNHHFWGDISSWFTQALSGIRMAPHGEPNEVDFRPSFISRLTHAEAFHSAPAGRIASAWERDEDDVIVLTVELPSTMHGIIRLESGYVFEDGLAYKAAESGTYRIHSIE